MIRRGSCLDYQLHFCQQLTLPADLTSSTYFDLHFFESNCVCDSLVFLGGIQKNQPGSMKTNPLLRIIAI
uniref:Uncharacterized protein n=1 Tax=Utricularia reniformis TaxID=192314 RepID=A0A1Y0B1N3_9LAMI|nr:hypothetical protein AEK19_MT1100 [Utricularia reniformis]ART31320.1 hypothetical protein AEK19_MT1100 [Utricularia reniformis]